MYEKKTFSISEFFLTSTLTRRPPISSEPNIAKSGEPIPPPAVPKPERNESALFRALPFFFAISKKNKIWGRKLTPYLVIELLHYKELLTEDLRILLGST